MQTSLPGHDHTTDANPVAIHFAESVAPLPDYCKELEKTAGFAANAFADQRNSLFPISSPGHTLMSGLYALGLPDSPTKAAALAKIEAAVSSWGIKEDWEKYATAFNTAVKEAAAEEAFPVYALTIEETGEHYYPIGNSGELQKSASALHIHAREGRIPASWISEAGRTIKTAAARFGMSENELPSFINEIGRRRELDFDRALALTHTRKAACEANGNDFTAYEDVVKAASEASPEELPDFIQLIEDLDIANGIKYGSHVPLPEQIFYSGMTSEEFEKFASAHIPIAGVLIPQTVVGSVKEASVRQHWTKNDAESLLGCIKAAVDFDTSLQATQAFDALPETLNKEFLAFLVART
jgi:hypothetical protein